MSRRDVLVKGTLVAGAAWTAPMLMSTRAYAFGVSTCPDPNRICGPAGSTQTCCPGPIGEGDDDFRCVQGDNGFVCAAPTEPGGVCGNNGEGTSSCQQGSHCNGNSASNACRCSKPNICGGNGATCQEGVCAPGFVCSGGFCRPSCAVRPCPTGLLTNGTTFTCVAGVCQQTCDRDQDCPSGQRCSAGFCA